ncbi:restriction endonuclease subunit S [Clostridium sp. AF15-41]|jgi:type I restriction enzyme S subunit|uniref:restriction endonuclease subunit S n=1 Tax=Clostridium sp. AF15-41 TaxID=2292996 RepID=UPI000E708B07|nr:restriction endonuclease subunit S [Clostridium sp. AF15-41]RJX00275.1 restriction endonuclease subunit S [Clostridium sp. AF15-41]
MAEMKDSGIEWVGKISENWKVLKNKYNFVLSKEIIGTKWVETQLLSLTKYGIKAINDGEQTGKVPASLSTYQKVNKDDLVMCLFDLDCSAVFSGISNFDGMISPAYKCIKCKAHLFPKYIDYYFKTVFVDRKYKRYSKNVRFSISADEFMNLPIIIPPKDIQTKIADFLDKKCAEIDALHTDIEKQIETLEEYKKSIITEAVTKGLINININGTQVDFTNTTDEQWECKKLKLLVAMPIIDGPHESPELCDTGIPYISATAIVDGKIDFNLMRGYISEEYCTECEKRYKPQLNDILVVKLGAGTGQVAMVDDNRKFNIWVPLAAVRCNGLVIPKFIYYGFQSDYVVTQMEQSWTYGTQETLGVKTIEKLKFFIPTLNTQRKIIQYLDNKCVNIDGAIEEKKEQLDTLEQYKKSLIYEYVTGKKEVK